MGHKKPRSTATTTTAAPPSPPPPPPSQQQPQPYDHQSSVNQELARAFFSSRRGNHSKALRMMKDLCQKYDTSALVFRVHGSVAAKYAASIDDPAAKHRQIKAAIASAKKATELSPCSVEFACFYASLLYDTANDGKDYEEVVAECERALAIETPNDPAKENPLYVATEAERTVDDRVANVLNELRSLIQKSNIASISSWMKNLGGGVGDGDRFRFVPVRRFSEDPMDSRYFQTNGGVRRPNEIKKATKTPEERRKEIEVRVAAARLLQKQQEQEKQQQQKSGGGDDSTRRKDSTGSAGVGTRAGERRRHGHSRRNASGSEKEDQVRSYWNSISYEMKRDLLRVRVSDIRAHFSNSSSKGSEQVSEVLSEALACGEANRTWKFWVCCRCREKFIEADSHMHHVVQEHMGDLLPKSQSTVPQSVDNEWAERLLSCSWKPLDLTASVKLLEDLWNREGCEVSGRKNDVEQTNECWSDNLCSGEPLEPLEEKNVSDGCDGEGNNSINECKTCDGNEGSKVYNLPSSWPLSNDAECEKLLEKISSLFEVLVSRKYLAVRHLHKVIQYTMDELHTLVPGSRILNCGVDQTPTCICFLEGFQLRKIMTYLQEVSLSCGLSRYPEKVAPEDARSHPESSDWKETIMLNEDASSLLLDEGLLACDDAREDVVSGSPVVSSEKVVQSGNDSLLSWIYAGPPCVEQLKSWSTNREVMAQQGKEVLITLEKEFGQLQTMCGEKFEHLKYEEALQRVEELCLEEKRREHVTETPPSSYDLILRRRKYELDEVENEVMPPNHRVELDVISNLIKEVENLNCKDETYGGITSHMYDLEAGEDDWKAKEHLRHLDSCVEIVLQRQKDNISTELSKLDARILRCVATMQHLELQLEPISAFDYRSILVPLVKSFMRARLEDLAGKYATEKSDAAREAFLAELALDSKRGTGTGNENSKNMQEKTKKKNRDVRRSKDGKVGSYNEQPETADVPHATSPDGDHTDNDDILVSGTDGNIKELEEEEVRRKIQLEAEERKLEERLAFQRRIENEAKEKLLAEQRRRNALGASEGVAEELADVTLEPGISGALHNKCSEPLASKNVYSHNLDGMQRNVNVHTDCSVVADGLLNEGVSNNEVFPRERRTGRRSRHRTSPKVPGGQYQAASLGKENVESSTPDAKLKDQVWNEDDAPSPGDSVSKTLRELQAEEDAEERFQADLKKAVLQSLDTFEAQRKLPLVINSRGIQKTLQDVDSTGTKAGEVMVKNVDETELVGAGLLNEVGEYNCFLNVVIQSLWHLRRFREEFLRRSASEHVHIGDPCVVCALFDILTALSAASADGKREPVAPTSLRIALSNLCPENKFFREGQMNDASEVLEVIFESFHKSFISSSAGSDDDSVDSNRGLWDCTNRSCLVHTLFGMNISQHMNCSGCHLESTHLKYTTFFHNSNASALRTMKVMNAESSFAELLNAADLNVELTCDPEAGGCGKRNHIHHILANPPHVFTTALGWQNTCETVGDISGTLAALATEIDISALYGGLDHKTEHRLVSVVCYYGQHYHCFAYSCEHERWIMYDDQTVKVIGSWDDVISMCVKGRLQPQLLFYEAVN